MAAVSVHEPRESHDARSFPERLPTNVVGTPWREFHGESRGSRARVIRKLAQDECARWRTRRRGVQKATAFADLLIRAPLINRRAVES